MWGKIVQATMMVNAKALSKMHMCKFKNSRELRLKQSKKKRCRCKTKSDRRHQ